MDGMSVFAGTFLDEPVFQPGASAVAHSQLTAFQRWCETETGRSFPDYETFDQFSVDAFREFWQLFLRWSGLPREGAIDPACVGNACESARFFPELRLNYAECALSGDPGMPAITACHANGSRDRLSRGELRRKVAQLTLALESLGVKPGDRVAAVARNNAEVVIAALAAAALGATFSSCALDMGAPAILARFAPLTPVALFGNLRPEPWDLGAPVAARVAETVAGLPSLAAFVALDDGPMPSLPATVSKHRLADLTRDGGKAASPAWPRHPFNHPLFILFSSGTTGAPKCIVHGAGGTLIEHVKEHRLHCDLQAGDKLFFQTSCGWMMWNWQLSALASGAEIVVYDGPLDGPQTFWQLVAGERVTVFGTNPAYLQFCEERGYAPGRMLDLSALRAVLSTGSVLHPRQYDWVREQVKAAVPLQSISGGTDIIGCFVLGNPNLPVHRGDAQCRSLGLDVRALLPSDEPSAQTGELICANPFPSRPLGFYGDVDGARFHAAYFAANPGVWTHGDLIEARSHGGWRLHGRSDGVLNVRGIRVGTAEIYRILGDIDEITEAMAVEQNAQDEPGGTRMALLVVLRKGASLDGALTKRIRSELAQRGSPAHVPARIAQVEALPVTFSGKRSETAARDAVNGRPVRNRDALRNPECLDAIADHPALRPAALERARECHADADHTARGDALQRDLQAICERILAVPQIGPADNLLTLGADSLTLVNLLLAIEEHVGRSVPLSALLSAPTIERLAAVLSDTENAAETPDASASGPSIRPVTPADVEPLCQFLEHGFAASGIKAKTWTRLFDHAWTGAEYNRGFVLTVGNEIVGFLSTIVARRRIGGNTGLTCNYSAWYVRPEYRGWGMALLGAAAHDDTTTYTAITPGPTSWAALEALGFTRLDAHRIVMPPLLHAGTMHATRRPQIHFDPTIVRRMLDNEQRRVFDDHAPYDCLQLVVSDGPEYAYIVVKRRAQLPPPGRLRRLLPVKVPYSDVLHCSAPHLLAKHLEWVKLAILRRQRTAALVADSRLFPVQPRGLRIKSHACYRSPLFSAGELDKLYSELVLLPI